MRSSVALLFGVFGSAAFAGTWYVDASKPASGDGTSAETAFVTIQEGVDAAASSGDTVLVAPGVYDQGVTWDGTANSRVVIVNKSLTVKSTGGRTVTEIVGRHTTSATNYGDDAIRCVYAREPSGGKIQIIGFTLRDGQAPQNTSASAAGMGGGLNAGNTHGNVQLIDCTVKNCRASRGAGLCGGCAIRTLIVGNRNLYAHGGVATSAVLFNCIATGCELGKMPALQGCQVVNCTIYGNGPLGAVASEGSLLRNCVLVANASGVLAGPDAKFTDLSGSVLSGAFAGTADKSDNFIQGATDRPFFAPALGDFRLMAGTAAATNGRAEYMYEEGLGVLPDEADRYLDFAGHPIPQTGVICAGALQELAPAHQGGRLTFPAGGITVFGRPTLTNSVYAYTAHYPELIHLPAEMFVGGTNIYCYSLGAWDVRYRESSRAPMMDGSFYAMPPPGADDAQLIAAVPAPYRYYVNPKEGVGDDTNNDGLSAATPFRTLQKAVDTALEGAYTVIIAAEGDYGEEQGTTSIGDSKGTHPTRVVVPSGKYVRIVGAGKGKSRLFGKRDDVTTGQPSGSAGCGPNAIRCISFATGGVLQGFSIHDGYAGYDSVAGTGDMSLSSGGGVLGETYTRLADCIVTNCCGLRGAVRGCGLSRCALYDCTGYNTGSRGANFFSSCLLVNCRGTGAGSFIYGGDITDMAVVHCSMRSGTTQSDTYGSGRPLWYSVIQDGKLITPPNSIAGCVFNNIAGTKTAGTGYKIQYPQFASTRDLRPMAGFTPLDKATDVPTASNFGTEYYKYATTDIDGRPWKLNGSGAPMIGCYALPYTRVDSSVVSTGTIAPKSDMNLLEDGASMTFTYTPDPDHPNRPYLGFEVNGELVTGPEAMTYTFTAPTGDQAGGVFYVKAMTSTNWYVNAAAADDNGNGFTPETAKRTLAGVMACDLMSKDCVHAAAGTYAEGGMTGHLGPTQITTNRVEISAGITLVSDEGPEKTVIRGKLSDQPLSTGYPAYGRGPGAMRAVWMAKGARLKGFTIVDGMTSCLTSPVTDDPDNLDHTAGGIYAEDRVDTYIENCVITNCTANRSGGAQNGTFVNCRFYQNASIGGGQGDVGSANVFYGCYVGKQRSSNGIKGAYRLEGCTVDGCAAVGWNTSASVFAIRNCLFLGSVKPSDVGTKTFENCIFAKTVDLSACTTATFTDCATYAASELQADAQHRPVYGKNKAINAANAALVTMTLATDAAGGQRVYDGCLDVGAFECDYRPVYAAKLGVPAVTAASPDVTLETASVRVPAGSSLTADVSDAAAGRRVRYTTQVTGEGALEVGQNGAALATVRQADGCVTKRFTADAENLITFDMTGDGAADLVGFTYNLGTLLLLR